MTTLKDEPYKKSVRMPTFDGSEENFPIFWMCFKAFAKVYRFAPALKIGGETDLPDMDFVVIDITTKDGRNAAAAKKRSEVCFTMAFVSEGTLSLVYQSETPEWPDGAAHLIVVSMLNKYQPQDTATRVE